VVLLILNYIWARHSMRSWIDSTAVSLASRIEPGA
jgi:hypothetical protein